MRRNSLHTLSGPAAPDVTAEDASASKHRINLPVGVRLALGHLRTTFARSRERQHEFERELRHRGTTP
jgi:hypothetical protein